MQVKGREFLNAGLYIKKNYQKRQKPRGSKQDSGKMESEETAQGIQMTDIPHRTRKMKWWRMGQTIETKLFDN